MTTIDNAAIARQLGYSRDEMIAKFGNPGEKTPTEIGSLLGLDSSTITSIFGDSSQGDTFTSSSSVAQEADDEVVNYANYWGVSYETARAALKAQFGDPEGYEGADENTSTNSSSVAQNADDEVVNYANYWGVSYEAAREALKNQFGDPEGYEGADEDTSSSSSTKNDNVDSFTKTQDDKYKEVADALGYDELSVSAVMKAVANGYSGTPETVVPQIASYLGLPETFVANVLRYLNNNQI